LEHLHFDGYGFPITRKRKRKNGMTFKFQWALAHLQTLIFNYNPRPGLMDFLFSLNCKKKPVYPPLSDYSDLLIKLMHSCSKLEELYVGLPTLNVFSVRQPNGHCDAYRSISKQTHLRKLIFSGIEFTCGDFLQQVRLHFLV
jgi:hypothetical protein